MQKIINYCGEKFILSEETAKHFKEDMNITSMLKIPNSDNYQIELNHGSNVYWGMCKKYKENNYMSKITFENKAVDLKAYPYDIFQENSGTQKPSKEQYEQAKENISYLNNALYLSRQRQTKLIDELSAERENEKMYLSSLEKNKETVLVYETYEKFK